MRQDINFFDGKKRHDLEGQLCIMPPINPNSWGNPSKVLIQVKLFHELPKKIQYRNKCLTELGFRIILVPEELCRSEYIDDLADEFLKAIKSDLMEVEIWA